MKAATSPSYKTGYAHDGSESAYPNLWSGLVGAWCPFLGPTGKVTHGVSQTSGVWLPNLISGDKLTIANDYDEQRFLVTNGTWAFSHQNSGFFPDSIEDFSSRFSTEATIFFRFRFFANSNTNSLPFGPSVTNRTHYLFNSALIYLSVFSTTRRINGASSSGMDITSWHSACITSKPGAGNYKFYYNGRLRNTGTGDATIANMSNGTLFSGSSADANGLNGPFSAIYLYNRVLSASEIRDLHRDETAPLQKKLRTRFFVPAGGGGFQPAWASRATQVSGVMV